jgi:short-subunit dehydrogenase
MRLQGARVVVTGASLGIGRATALLLARDGARVLAAARDEQRLRELASEQPGIDILRTDVTDESDRAALVAAAGDIDVLVNNAGVGWKGLVEEMPPDDVRTLLDLNVLSLIDLTQKVLPGMLGRARGHVVNVGSVGGFVGVPGETVYCTTKFAVQGFTDGLRRELRGRGVDVTLIAPGPIKTEFLARATTGAPAAEPGSLDYGMSADSVARAIRRALTRRIPGYRTISVPRVLGISRLGSMPGMARLSDLATTKRARQGRRRDVQAAADDSLGTG